jgi:histidine triad (HIT) family protein
MSDCIFCNIANGTIPSEKIWEDKNFLAFLDIHPATEGMVLVIPKRHLNSYIFQNEDVDIHNLMSAAKRVSKLLEEKLTIERVCVVFEGIEVSHLHTKLYPLRMGESLKMVMISNDYAPTQEQLHELALKIRG